MKRNCDEFSFLALQKHFIIHDDHGKMTHVIPACTIRMIANGSKKFSELEHSDSIAMVIVAEWLRMHE